MGYQTGRGSLKESNEFDCLREWVAVHYNVYADGRDGFALILEKSGGNEGLAFDEFFRLLPLYLNDRKELGFEAIIGNFSKVMDDIVEAGEMHRPPT